MRWLLTITVYGAIVGTAWGQSFAPAQPRVAERTRPSAIVTPSMARARGLGVGENTITRSGMPVPVPLGLEGENAAVGVLAGRTFTGGSLVGIPRSAVGTDMRLYTFTSDNGRLLSVAYNPGTGATVVYDQTTSFSLRPPINPSVPTIATQPGTGAYSGIITNPTFSLVPGTAVPSSGIPLLNQAAPTYSYSNGLGTNPAPVPTRSPFSGITSGSFAAPAASPGVGASVPTTFSIAPPSTGGP